MYISVWFVWRGYFVDRCTELCLQMRGVSYIPPCFLYKDPAPRPDSRSPPLGFNLPECFWSHQSFSLFGFCLSDTLLYCILVNFLTFEYIQVRIVKGLPPCWEYPTCILPVWICCKFYRAAFAISTSISSGSHIPMNVMVMMW